MITREYLCCRFNMIPTAVIELIPRGKVSVELLPEPDGFPLKRADGYIASAVADRFVLAELTDHELDQVDAGLDVFYRVIDYLCSQGWESFAVDELNFHFTRQID